LVCARSDSLGWASRVACKPSAEARVMADRSNFWKIVDRTKPSKLRDFAESELRDCQDYFLEIQSDSTLPPTELITASERLALIRSEIDLRHSDAKHGQTQRLARWAIGIGIVGIFSAVVAIANRPTPQHVPAAATEAAQTPAVIPPTPATLPMTTPTPAALLTTTPTPAASPTMYVVSTRTPTTQQKKTRRTRRKRPTPPPSFWDRLFKAKSTR
jgi:hypothetical protein